MRRGGTAQDPEDRRTAALLDWFRRHRRPLPWRTGRDPYRVWVSEVLLQQTRVAQAVPYFERFLARFPSVGSLARAPVADVLRVWQGAGYYARARHLHAAARTLVRAHGGQLPTTVEELEQLPGVGPYIARAIASLAFQRPVLALEANGLRVAARWFREEGDLRSGAVRSRLAGQLAARFPRRTAGAFNEALMELGETVCRPVAPRCPDCPVARDCRAFLELADPGRLPARRRRPARPHLRVSVVVVSDRNGRWLVQRRPLRGLLGGLWEFPGGKIRQGELPRDAARRELREETGVRLRRLEPAGIVRHAYSHFTVELHVFRGGPVRAGPRPTPLRKWVAPHRIRTLPLPKATERIVERLASSPGGRHGGEPPGRRPFSIYRR